MRKHFPITQAAVKHPPRASISAVAKNSQVRLSSKPSANTSSRWHALSSCVRCGAAARDQGHGLVGNRMTCALTGPGQLLSSHASKTNAIWCRTALPTHQHRQLQLRQRLYSLIRHRRCFGFAGGRHCWSRQRRGWLVHPAGHHIFQHRGREQRLCIEPDQAASAHPQAQPSRAVPPRRHRRRRRGGEGGRGVRSSGRQRAVEAQECVEEGGLAKALRAQSTHHTKVGVAAAQQFCDCRRQHLPGVGIKQRVGLCGLCLWPMDEMGVEQCLCLSRQRHGRRRRSRPAAASPSAPCRACSRSVRVTCSPDRPVSAASSSLEALELAAANAGGAATPGAAAAFRSTIGTLMMSDGSKLLPKRLKAASMRTLA